MSLTDAQQAAVAARGNVLVVAGAGTGKTRTLVERCLDCLEAEAPRASLDELLIVTFTEAAAAEVRQRLRERVQEQAARQPQEAHWPEQLALFETAHIGTLHSFCLKLLRRHFYELGLDPQFSVMAEEEGRLLAEETLETLLQKYYAGRGPAAETVQQLFEAQGQGSDQPIRALVLRLYHYTQTLADPPGWFEHQMSLFGEPEPKIWRDWFASTLLNWPAEWTPQLRALASGNQVAAACASLLEALPAGCSGAESLATLSACLATAENCPHGKKDAWHKPLKDFLNEARFLLSLAENDLFPDPAARQGGRETPNPENSASAPAHPDPLAEDWGWVRSQMRTLVELAHEFTEDLAHAKQELGMVDFHDLEQHALRLLWDPRTNQPTTIARHWRQQLRFVFVDEYQDINAAQDKIIEALSRAGAGANRFLVGDVKQSIYRFRLANPHIFQRYMREWGRSDTGAISTAASVIPLSDNFRSREGILEVVNSLFERLMRPDTGGVVYDESARLRFGAPQQRLAFSRAANPKPAVELHIRFKSNNADPSAEDDPEWTELNDLKESAKEARLVAGQLQQLKLRRELIWDEKIHQFRAVDWDDMAVLLRSPATKSESYAKEFARLNVPLQVARSGFYRSLEIGDLLSLLQVLDNPLQDLPVLAVLRSPLVGLTLNELAAVRLALPRAHFWAAVVRWVEKTEEGKQETAGEGKRGEVQDEEPRAAPQLKSKLTAFLNRFGRWRRLAREVPLSRCLEAILTETHYADWLLTQPHGEQRHANVQRLLHLAQEFDQFQRQGLFRFLRFIEAQQQAETEPEVPPVSGENAVRLMSVHQSKGLEFPVVVAADLGKPFNLADLRAEVILDEKYGLCPQVRPPRTNQYYPSLPYWLARRSQLKELLGEEMRLLYVAMTRARDRLILSGSVAARRFEKVWQSAAEGGPATLLGARSYADWLGLWFSEKVGPLREGIRDGEIGSLRWAVHEDIDLLGPREGVIAEIGGEDSADAEPGPPAWHELERRLSWRYPFTAATNQPAKTSVSALRHRTALGNEESADLFPEASQRKQKGDAKSPPRASERLLGRYGTDKERRSREGVPSPATAAEVGLAHHHFLQLLALEKAGSIESLKREAQRLQDLGALIPGEISLLNFEALARFWTSDLGRKISSELAFIQRELPFTARFSARELAEFTGHSPDASLDREFVVVQGVADLVVIRPQEIWLVDYKTDTIHAGELRGRAESYRSQIQLYARALSRIYRRPVTQCWLYFLSVPQAVAVPVV